MTAESLSDAYVSGLRDAHALEKQALQLMERQVERIENYPEVARLLRSHIHETEEQVRRIDEILHFLGEDRSLLKDMATAVTGNMAAMAHMVMTDEILKNHFANHAFENYEIAAYLSLIAMAEAAGHPQHVPALRATLSEEERMATTLREMTPQLTQQYLSLYQESNLQAKV
jgi:ferritin-like metal-binding protein YciE